MKINYFPDTDKLYIDLDMDADGNTVGIEIEHASKSVDFSNV